VFTPFKSHASNLKVLTIYTIGHSTRPLDEFIALLAAHGIRQLVDIRSMPRSRRHPHFSSDALSASLGDVKVSYRHSPALGGLRKPRRDSLNTAWQVEGFRGYADYMETDAFRAALEELVAFAAAAPTAIMCAEAVWWRCHRQLVADALVARGIEVRHITSITAAPAHTLTDFAEVSGGLVAYRRLI
jgi:uncharacterized protein (DUF488 family)